MQTFWECVCVDSLIEGRQFTDRPGTNMRHRVTYWTVVHTNVYSIYHPCNPRAPRVWQFLQNSRPKLIWPLTPEYGPPNLGSYLHERRTDTSVHPPHCLPTCDVPALQTFPDLGGLSTRVTWETNICLQNAEKNLNHAYVEKQSPKRGVDFEP